MANNTMQMRSAVNKYVNGYKKNGKSDKFNRNLITAVHTYINTEFPPVAAAAPAKILSMHNNPSNWNTVKKKLNALMANTRTQNRINQMRNLIINFKGSSQYNASKQIIEPYLSYMTKPVTRGNALKAETKPSTRGELLSGINEISRRVDVLMKINNPQSRNEIKRIEKKLKEPAYTKDLKSSPLLRRITQFFKSK